MLRAALDAYLLELAEVSWLVWTGVALFCSWLLIIFAVLDAEFNDEEDSDTR
jgi:hypothetical protein